MGRGEDKLKHGRKCFNHWNRRITPNCVMCGCEHFLLFCMLSFIFSSLTCPHHFDAGNWTQDLLHAKQILYHWATPQPFPLFLIPFFCLCQWNVCVLSIMLVSQWLTFCYLIFLFQVLCNECVLSQLFISSIDFCLGWDVCCNIFCVHYLLLISSCFGSGLLPGITRN